ncbi:peptidylprolyl isomerase [Prochlorococcus marinus XMU1408]|uniref:Peptidyl-prolyl cis-trans isomerase n=1 Tax=Prochlorococcus marinus XMU1408 TaxID=2213228 RepID=A0A318R3G1_PROMR|nr:peptidylprolyl isomerase [Prochlorococcus marinus str. XMU1408]PYE01431.1 peptidylprolyl isomerase [Prochlorococcus marinus XMU1408]
MIKKILNNSTLRNKLFQSFNIFLCVNSILIFGCSSLKKNVDINICSSTNKPCLSSTEYVLLITNKGNIKLELYGKLAPITVGNFIDFVEKGAYNKTIFNRVIRKPFPFIIRGGDNSLVTGENKFIDSNTGKIRYIPLEIKLKSNNLPTYGKEIEVSSQKNNIELKHKRYYLSMARSENVNSASSQFYISLKSLPELDGRFAVFGKVISGMSVLDLLQEEDFIVEAKKL